MINFLTRYIFETMIMAGVILGWVVQFEKGKKFRSNHIHTIENAVNQAVRDIKETKERVGKMEDMTYKNSERLARLEK